MCAPKQHPLVASSDSINTLYDCTILRRLFELQSLWDALVSAHFPDCFSSFMCIFWDTYTFSGNHFNLKTARVSLLFATKSFDYIYTYKLYFSVFVNRKQIHRGWELTVNHKGSWRPLYRVIPTLVLVAYDWTHQILHRNVERVTAKGGIQSLAVICRKRNWIKSKASLILPN